MARPIVKEPVIEKNEEYVLKAVDRCDRCNAPAYVLVKGISGELMFCGHHYEKIMNDSEGHKKMMSFMLEVVDERNRLIENKLVGSHN